MVRRKTGRQVEAIALQESAKDHCRTFRFTIQVVDGLQHKDKGNAEEMIVPSIQAGEFDSEPFAGLSSPSFEVRNDGWLLNTNGCNPQR
jgi:hypothetical protein